MTTESTCRKAGCPRRPTHYLVLAVPGTGAGPNHPKCRMTIGLQLCHDHAREAIPADIITVAGEKLVRAAMRSYGWASPDFARAEIEPRRLGDKNWTIYSQSRTRGSETLQ